MTGDLYSNIIQKFKKGLPAGEAHKKMSPVDYGHYKMPRGDYKEAGVVLLVYPKNGLWHVLFIRRTSHHPEDKHAGQISFPGGRRESADLDMLDCAKRELLEEVGVAESEYRLIGSLSPIYVYVSNFLVFPYAVMCQTKPDFKPQESEVAGIIEYPLSKFLGFSNRKIKDLKVRNSTIKDMPYFDLDGQVLWGATAMIMSEFVYLLDDISID